MGAFASVGQFARMLRNLDEWLERATVYAAQKNFEPEVLAAARLAPDQYDLVRQVQSACDAAKFTAAHLAGRKAPAHPDDEKTVAELRSRIRTCIAYLDTFQAADFVGAEERRVAPGWMEGKSVRGDLYLLRIGEPNFYFHVTTAYAILRHNGVDLGKGDYIGVKNWAEIADWG